MVSRDYPCRNSHPLLLVSERADWIERAKAELPHPDRPMPRVVCSWETLPRGPTILPRLILWDFATEATQHSLNLLGGYASQYFNRVSVVCLEQLRANGSILEEVAEMGYRHIHLAGNNGFRAMRISCHDVFHSAIYLLPGLMRLFQEESEELAQALARVLEEPNAARTVTGWSRRLGFSDQHGVERLLRRHKLPGRPWEIFAWLRLLAALDWAAVQRKMPSTAEVARSFKYSSGKYLNQHALRLSGRKFPALLEEFRERSQVLWLTTF